MRYSPRRNSYSLALPSTLWLFVLIALTVIYGRLSYSQIANDKQGASSTPTDGTLARAQSEILDRHYSEAVRILRSALLQHPEEVVFQLELGRAYLATGKDRKAQGLFQEILKKEPGNRFAQLELARTLAYRRRYEQSDQLYRQLLFANAADETAAIGLTSNLMHEGRSAEAAAVANTALGYHPNSLRLLEYKDRIAGGLLAGEERPPQTGSNFFSAATDYVNDSAGNHSWLGTQHLDLRIRPALTSDLHVEQHFLHSLDDSRELVQTFSETIRWKPFERLAVSGGGGGIRFDKGDVRAIYEATLSGLLGSHFLLGAGFSRIPIVPDAEAAEHQLTAQGWEAFSLWTHDHWHVNMRASRRHYSDDNIGDHEWAEVLHQWTRGKLAYSGGYRFRHYGFSKDLAHGYFSPDNYQSHQASFGVVIRPSRRYRGELTALVGAESIASGADFQFAWEINVRNQLTLGRCELNLDYSKYRMAQATGAFRADAGRFEFAYRF